MPVMTVAVCSPLTPNVAFVLPIGKPKSFVQMRSRSATSDVYARESVSVFLDLRMLTWDNAAREIKLAKVV